MTGGGQCNGRLHGDKFGAHHALMKELASEDPHSFRNFIRMDKQDFDEVLTKVTPFIQKQDTNMLRNY